LTVDWLSWEVALGCSSSAFLARGAEKKLSFTATQLSQSTSTAKIAEEPMPKVPEIMSQSKVNVNSQNRRRTNAKSPRNNEPVNSQRQQSKCRRTNAKSPRNNEPVNSQRQQPKSPKNQCQKSPK
jgi:hypothetical protein